MRLKHVAGMVAILAGPSGAALAQTPTEPPPLALPMGARVRFQTTTAAGRWMKGTLASADSASVAIVPEGAPPLGANQLRVPSASVTRFEMATGRKRQWLIGLLVGAAVGVTLGFTDDVDPELCKINENVLCSRGEAVAIYGFGMAAMGAGIGALVKTDRWTPVALEALAPPPPRVSGVAPRLRALPGGGLGLSVAVGF